MVPPVIVTNRLSIRNCTTMSRAVAPTTRRRPDLARPLENRRQHDVHYADAADEEREHRHAAHHHVEGPLRADALIQQVARHHDVERGGAPVCAAQGTRNRPRDHRHVVAVGDLNPDLVDRLPRSDRRAGRKHAGDGPQHDAVEIPGAAVRPACPPVERAASTPTTSHQP